MSDDIDTSAEACAVACMLVSNPGGETRNVGWQKRVNDLIRALRAELSAERLERAELFEDAKTFVVERDALRAELAAAEARINELEMALERDDG